MNESDLHKNNSYRQIKLVAWLSFKDILSDWKLILCLMIAVAALIAPLLILLGLRTGVVDTLRQRLLSDPKTLELTLKGNFKLDENWFNEIASLNEVGFIIPMTRSLSAQVDLVKTPRDFMKRVIILPTAENDPLLKRANLSSHFDGDAIIISSVIAEKLALNVGDEIDIRLARKVNNKRETGQLRVTIEAVAPETITSRAQIFAQLPLLIGVENYIDGVSDTILFNDDASNKRTVYARARLYAKTLEDVAPLAEHIRKRNIDVITEADKIDTVKAIDRAAGFIFATIAYATSIGGAAALIGLILVNIDRRRKELALLRLIGFSRASMVIFPICQSMLIGLCGYGLAALAYSVSESSLNATLGASLISGEFVSYLPFALLLKSATALFGVCAIAASLGGYYATKIDPAEPLRSN